MKPIRCKWCRWPYVLVSGIMVCMACDFCGDKTMVPDPSRLRQQVPE